MIAADRYLKEQTDDYFDLSPEQAEFQKKKAFTGMELVKDTHHLALMNALLHDMVFLLCQNCINDKHPSFNYGCIEVRSLHFTLSNSGNVYFIQSSNDGPIKIGFATNVQRRLQQLQTANPEELKLLHSTTGGKRFEFYLHEKFEIYNKRNEWFFPDEEIKTYIDKIRVEDKQHGKIISIREFAKSNDYHLSKDELFVLDELTNHAILDSRYNSMEKKEKFWRIIDDYLEYQKIFPDRLITERHFRCFVSEGRKHKERLYMKQNNIILKNL